MLSCIPLVALVVLCAGDIATLFAEPLGASGHPLGAVVHLIFNASRQDNALSSAVVGLIAPISMMPSTNTTAAASRMLFLFVRDDHSPFVYRAMYKLMAVTCSLYSRFYQPNLLGRDFTGIFHLGTFWEKTVDGVSVVFLTFVWVLCRFPFTTPVDGTALNYAPVIDVGLGIGFTVYCFAYARHRYTNPAPEEIGNVNVPVPSMPSIGKS
ncbi:uncharacterized protein LTR77_010000 [Saxophila tyrrhenica]|uniref:Uncharacterized protein n=1 Tax=Saxophila tyrrhenica TaxID=1690608 RepID=A0AAV9NX66_9PEZI|nr:hypothetical protein LTR77_010000 [Saxophila tyrrhenica]